jgi:hypothetical protein
MAIMNRAKLCRAVIGGLGLLFLQMNSTALLAADDVPLSPAAGTEMGTDILTAGTGMEGVKPPDSGNIDFTVPPGARIVQVILYWEGYMLAPDLPVLPAGGGDAEITVNSVDITGTLLTKGFSIGSEFASYAYRDDITTLVENTVGLGPGSKTLTITNMDFDDVNDGAGVMVILDDGTDQAEIGLLEGNDFAYISGANLDRQTTVAQTFNFTPSADERTVNIELMFASVTGDASGGGDRPSAIDVTIGAAPPQTFNNLLDSVDGDEWDSVTLSSLTVPAAVSSITVQAFSEDRLATGQNPASFHWISAGLAVTPPPPPEIAQGRMTGGGKIKDNGIVVKTSFTVHCDITLSNNIQINWKDQGNNRWHLKKPITSAVCTDDPEITQPPPAAPLDTFVGEAVGKLNGVSGSHLKFTFVDGGEPGRNVDSMAVTIWAPGDNPETDDPVLEASGQLKKGNYQAHYDQPHK